MSNYQKNTESVDEFFAEKIKNPEFAAGYQEEHDKLEAAARLVNARVAAGLTQRELAEKTQIPQTTIARIERGHNTSIETLSRLASALGVQLKVTIG